MIQYTTKLLITVSLIILISEISKRSSLLAGIFASIPLVSVLAMTWIYKNTHSTEQIIQISCNIFWLVIPSLSLYLMLPFLLKQGLDFYQSMGLSIIVMIFCYYLMIFALGKFGVSF